MYPLPSLFDLLSSKELHSKKSEYKDEQEKKEDETEDWSHAV